MNRRAFLGASAAAAIGAAGALPGPGPQLENEHFSIVLDPATGAITSLRVKRNGSELIGEKRLAANFRICLPLPDYLCNYIEGAAQPAPDIETRGNTIRVRFDRMVSPKGSYPLELLYTITLEGDSIRFRSDLHNLTPYPVSEFWFPRIGGWTEFGGRGALLATPGYTSCRHDQAIFRTFPGVRRFGAEAAEMSTDYPGQTMPWWDLYDPETGTGLYLGYHDPVFRFSTWHMQLAPDVSGEPGVNWLTPAQASGAPVGIVFSHVRYPFIKTGERFRSGEFILRAHAGDWHSGSAGYREWFLSHFPFDKSKSWLRKQSAWFSSIIYQPEDRIIADYRKYDQWCRDAETYGIRCHELIGWNKGGLERDYPEYVPEEKLGGREGYRALQRSIKSRGSRCLTFVNYNVLDSSTDLYREKLHRYRQQDQFGNPSGRGAWGESTLIARKGLSVHQHVPASVTPELEKLLEGYYLELVKDGAQGFQIDKTNMSRGLDFNPLNPWKPDEALCEGMVKAVGAVYEKCRALDPEFCLASEHSQDRLIPYVDVAYRACAGYSIAPLRYVFPEWTAAQHIHTPRDFRGVNGAVLTGAVICVEPDLYQTSLANPLYRELAEYIREVGRIREHLADIVFLGKYLDEQGAEVVDRGGARAQKALYFGVHAGARDGRKAIVVANDSPKPRTYAWRFTEGRVTQATLYAPFRQVRTVASGAALEIGGVGLHILVAS